MPIYHCGRRGDRRDRDREHPRDRDRQFCAARADRPALFRHPLLCHPERAGQAMRGKGMVALGRLVLAKRERVMVLEPYDKDLLGTTLRYPYEVRNRPVLHLVRAMYLLFS